MLPGVWRDTWTAEPHLKRTEGDPVWSFWSPTNELRGTRHEWDPLEKRVGWEKSQHMDDTSSRYAGPCLSV